MKIKVCIFLLFTLIFVYCDKISAETNRRIDPFRYALLGVLSGFSEKDSTAINRFVHPDVGVYVVYRRGASDTYTHIDQVDFSNTEPDYMGDYLLESPILSVSELTSLTEYNCETESWHLSPGVYYDGDYRDNRLSAIDTFREQDGQANFSDEIRESHIKLEKQSVRIIVITESEESLVFYLTQFNDAWYLSIIDRAVAECDA